MVSAPVQPRSADDSAAPETVPLLPWSRAAHAHLVAHADPVMAALARERGPVTRPQSREYFARLARAIVGQQISTKAAASIYGRVVERAGGVLTPASLQALDDETLRGAGLSQAKLLSLRDLAAHALDGRLDLAHVETLPDEEVAAQLVAVRGIGTWTAEMFLMFALGRQDILPVDDLGIQNAVERLYQLDAHPKPAQIRQLAAEGHWHPYATAACFYLWDYLNNAPIEPSAP